MHFICDRWNSVLIIYCGLRVVVLFLDFMSIIAALLELWIWDALQLFLFSFAIKKLDSMSLLTVIEGLCIGLALEYSHVPLIMHYYLINNFQTSCFINL